MLYYAYIVGITLARILPLKICYFVCNRLALAYYSFAKEDRIELAENLRVVLGEDTKDEVIEDHIRSIFVNFAKYLADFFRCSKYSKKYIKKNITIVGREHLDEALADGRGVILCALHLGNWELGGAVVGALGYPMNAIVLQHKNKRVNDFFVNQRGKNNLKSIPLGLQIRECFRVLKRNEALAIVGDKDYTSNGIEIDFFGKPAELPKGPAFFSVRTGAPIVTTVVTREADDTFTLYFSKPIKCEPTFDTERDIRWIMNRYIKDFEERIRMYPDQWYVFKRIWKLETTIQ